MKHEVLTDEEIETAHDAANSSFNKWRFQVRGQMVMPQDSWNWHFARAIEQAVLAKLEQRQEPVAFPEGYEIHELPVDYTGPVWIEGKVRGLYRLAAAPQPTPALLAAAEKMYAIYDKWDGCGDIPYDFHAALEELRAAIEAHKVGA